MIKTKKQGNLIIISGTTCAGKGSVIKKVLEKHNDIVLSVSYTSRPKREHEIDGVDYYFVTKEEFEKEIKKDSFLEYALVHGNYYGTLKRVVEKDINNGFDVILEIDIQGAVNIKAQKEDGIFIFIMPPSMRELKNRLVKRGTETKDKLVERFKNAYKEINEISKYNYVVINDEVEKAVKKVQAILLAERCRVDRIEEFDVNNQEELIHELLVDLKETK